MEKWLIPHLKQKMYKMEVKYFHIRQQGCLQRPLQSCQNDLGANFKRLFLDNDGKDIYP